MCFHLRGGSLERFAPSRHYLSTRLAMISRRRTSFLPMDPNLDSAPFSLPGQSGPPDEAGGEVEEESGAASSSQPAPRSKPKLDDWMKRRSVSRVRYGKRTVRVVRLSDPQVGFGRRRSPAPGKPRELKQGRKGSPPNIFTTRVAGTTGSASDLINRKAREKLAFRQTSKEL